MDQVSLIVEKQFSSEKLLIFAGKFDDFCGKILLIFGVDDHCRKVWQFLQKNLTFFAGKLEGFSGKFSDFGRKI